MLTVFLPNLQMGASEGGGAGGGDTRQLLPLHWVGLFLLWMVI